MANDAKSPAEEQREARAINRKLDNLNTMLDDIYKNVYSSDSVTTQQTSRISEDIYKSINNILSSNSDIQGMPDITQLYTRIEKSNTITSSLGTPKVVKDLIDVLGNEDLFNVLIADPEINRYIKAKDLQIDMVLKYMPKLAEALSIKKDNVLSADNFNKSYLNIINKGLSAEEQDTFYSQATHLIRKYRLEEKFEDIYENTAKYGEQFIYIVPYDKAIKRLHNVSAKRNVAEFPAATFESTDIISRGSIVDRSDAIDMGRDLEESAKSCGNVKIVYNDTNILSDVIKAYTEAERAIENNKGKSLYEAFAEAVALQEVSEDDDAIKKMSDSGGPVESDKISRLKKKLKLDKTVPDDLEYDKLYNTANDGLINSVKDIDADKIKPIPGAVFKILKHENVIPIYIEDICLGYYYLEFNYGENDDIDRSKLLLTNTFETLHKEDIRDDHDIVIRYIASKISQNIDAKFINANQDLKEEIYSVLKYNNRFNMNMENNAINVTYLPPQDLYHFYFKLDPDLHRGISDLDASLIPAMFWVLLDLVTTMGIVTRSQDHRVFYVRQNVEQNIAKTLMNVVNQLKKGNMGIRQMQSMNTILGVIGKYNDYVIPVGPSGDAPLSFDTIQGQQIETPKELMDKFEDYAINSTDVPLELVNSTNQVDYATRYVMQNSKFLRKVLKRQAIVQEKFTTMFSRVYNYEYNTNEKSIEVKLPTPVFLSSVNGLALINNVREYVNALAEIKYQQGTKFNEEEKAVFIQLLMEQQLGTYVDLDNLDDLVERARMIVAAPDNPEKEESSEGGDML